jgi:hypothetical protein
MGNNNCLECGGRLIPQTNGVWICEDCGIEQDSAPIDTSFRSLTLKELVERNYKKIPKKRWSKDTYSRNIKKLERLARLHLPEDFAESIIYFSKETLQKNYDEDIPKTRDKKEVVWTVFIGIVRYFIDVFSAEKDPNNKLISSCKNLLMELEKENQEGFQKATKSVDKIKFRVSPDIRKVDDRIPYIKDENGFFDLFYSQTLNISEEDKQKNIKEVIDAGMLVANIFLRDKIVKQINRKVKKIKLVSKRDGFFGACCYLACEKFGLNPKTQKEWAKFFHISPSLFDKALKEIRTTRVEPLGSKEA